jgi:hypothetical protein
MGIRVSCPNGHKLNVKEQLAGKRGICPVCRAAFEIPSAGEPRPAEPVSIVSGGAVVHASHTGVHVAPAAKSVVIPVVEPVEVAAPAISSPPSSAQHFAATSSAAPQAQQAPPPPAPIAIHSQVSVSDALESPSARFIAKRMRSRRNQTTLAIALLVAVILLAALLIWVLSRGPADSGDVARARISNATDAYYVIAAACNAASTLPSARL